MVVRRAGAGRQCLRIVTVTGLQIGTQFTGMCDHGFAESYAFSGIGRQCAQRIIVVAVQQGRQRQRVAGRFGHAHAAMRPRNKSRIARGA